MVAHAYRTTVNEATGYTPFFLMRGVEARQPSDLWIAEYKHKEKDLTDFTRGIVDVLTHTWTHLAAQRTAARVKQPRERKQRDFRPYKLGEIFYYERHPKRHVRDPILQEKRKISSKLQPRWTGPNRVTGIITPVTYWGRMENGRRQRVHALKMKRIPYAEKLYDDYDLPQIDPDPEDDGGDIYTALTAITVDRDGKIWKKF